MGEVFDAIQCMYCWPVGDLIMPDDSVDPYTEEGHEIDAEGGERFAATRKERDSDMLATLRGILEARGLGPELVMATPMPAKKRKPKTFKKGDKITSRMVRDVPEGSHFTWQFIRRQRNKSGNMGERRVTFDAVYLKRVKPGVHVIRPIQEGVAFASKEMHAHLLGGKIFDDATFVGPWTGKIMEVEVMGIKPTTEKFVRKTKDKG